MYHFVGPLRLEQLCVRRLISLREYLGDIGDTPVSWLTPVLQQCNAEQLAVIEDETRAGGRDIRDELAEHWARCYKTEFGPFPGGTLPKNGAHDRVAAGPPAGNWRLGWDLRRAYETKVQEMEDKKRASGKRLRAMWEEKEREKAERSLQVIQPKPMPRRCMPKDSWGGHSAAPRGTHDRIMKKLGMKKVRSGPDKGRVLLPGPKRTVSAPSAVRRAPTTQRSFTKNKAHVSTSQTRSEAALRVLDNRTAPAYAGSSPSISTALPSRPARDNTQKLGPRTLLTGSSLLAIAQTRGQQPSAKPARANDFQHRPETAPDASCLPGTSTPPSKGTGQPPSKKQRLLPDKVNGQPQSTTVSKPPATNYGVGALTVQRPSAAGHRDVSTLVGQYAAGSGHGNLAGRKIVQSGAGVGQSAGPAVNHHNSSVLPSPPNEVRSWGTLEEDDIF